MDAILQIDEQLFQQAQREAARTGKSIRAWVEEAVLSSLAAGNGHAPGDGSARREEFERLLQTAGKFRMGPRPTRDEMNER